MLHCAILKFLVTKDAVNIQQNLNASANLRHAEDNLNNLSTLEGAIRSPLGHLRHGLYFFSSAFLLISFNQLMLTQLT